MVGASSDPNSLKEYLKKYTSNDDKDKKKKKKRKAKPNASGVIVVDEDPVWQKPVNVEDEEDSAGNLIFSTFDIRESNKLLNTTNLNV